MMDQELGFYLMSGRRMGNTDLRIVTFLLDRLGGEIWEMLHSNECSHCEKPCGEAKLTIQREVLAYLKEISKWN